MQPDHLHKFCASVCCSEMAEYLWEHDLPPASRAEALKKLQESTAAEVDALLPPILDKAFKGDL